MSRIPYATQFGVASNPSQQAQDDYRITMIYLNGMSAKQMEMMKQAQHLLREILYISVASESDLNHLPKSTKNLVIPYRQTQIIRSIRQRMDKPQIYTARCIVEARKHLKIELPTRSLAISCSMANCKIFPVKSCNNAALLRKIFEMSGEILQSFDDKKLTTRTVVITDRADDKYSIRARQRNIPVVSTSWVEENYALSQSGDENVGHDAMSEISAHQVKPFLGLKFKITTQMDKELRDLIGNNGGKLVFGNEDATHVVIRTLPEVKQEVQTQASAEKQVDMKFLRVCAQQGYYITKKEYRDAISSFEPNCITPPQMASTLSSIQSMPPPPPTLPRPVRQFKAVDMNDIILKALSSCDNGTQQTQLASTQMRGLPENDIRFERVPESSQQLYWSDSIIRKQ